MKLKDLVRKLDELKELRDELDVVHENWMSYKVPSYNERVAELEKRIEELLDEEVN